jgi:hypothetical protein
MARGLISKATHALRYFLLRRLPTCKQMAVVMSESMERPLTLRERVTLRLHLWICIWCVWYLEHLHVLRDALRARAAQVAADEAKDAIHLSLDARERIKRVLKSAP